jgi:hypothetical protein
MASDPLIFPFVRFFAPYRQWQAVPFIDGNAVLGGPTFQTQGEAALAVIAFYQHFTAQLPEAAKNVKDVENPKGNEQNAKIKLGQITLPKKEIVKSKVSHWVNDAGVKEVVRNYLERIQERAKEKEKEEGKTDGAQPLTQPVVMQQIKERAKK